MAGSRRKSEFCKSLNWQLYQCIARLDIVANSFQQSQ